jgi:hypothetical protein
MQATLRQAVQSSCTAPRSAFESQPDELAVHRGGPPTFVAIVLAWRAHAKDLRTNSVQSATNAVIPANATNAPGELLSAATARTRCVNAVAPELRAHGDLSLVDPRGGVGTGQR